MSIAAGNMSNPNLSQPSASPQPVNPVDATLENQDMFRLAMEHSAMGMALVKPSGQWLKVNQALCDIIGYSEAELLTHKVQDISHPDDIAVDLKRIKQLLAGEISTYRIEKRYIHKNNSVIWALLTVSLIRDDDRNPKYFISQMQDITEEKKTREHLVEANNELLRLSYQISHDFRSPLNSCIDMLGHLDDDIKYKRYDELVDISHAIKKSLKKLHKLATDIISLNALKIKSENIRSVSVEKVVDDTIEHLGSIMNITNVHIRKDIRIMGTFKFKKNHFALIVNSLLSNAIRFKDPHEHTPLIVISAYLEGQYLVFGVSDNGLGIEERYHSRIFSMFERFHHMPEQGSGLGLYMAKQSSDAMGGTLTYSPTPNGSSFKLRFPV